MHCMNNAATQLIQPEPQGVFSSSSASPLRHASLLYLMCCYEAHLTRASPPLPSSPLRFANPLPPVSPSLQHQQQAMRLSAKDPLPNLLPPQLLGVVVVAP